MTFAEKTLSNLQSLFNGIADAFKWLIDVVTIEVNNTNTLVSHLTGAEEQVTESIVFLPEGLVTSLVVMIGIAVFFRIIGR